MSRIGKQPIPIPEGVTVTVQEHTVTVKGPKGTLSQDVNEDLSVAVQDGKVVVTRPTDEKRHKALHGLTRTLVANMVTGVTAGFQKNLELVGVGYRAQGAGKNLNLTVGFSHSVEVEPLEGVSFAVEANTRVSVMGTDKQKVGETAARIRAIRPPNVYTGKGIRYAGETVRRKAGKSASRSTR
jgi:large subunit ribosomal protein L6